MNIQIPDLARWVTWSAGMARVSWMPLATVDVVNLPALSIVVFRFR